MSPAVKFVAGTWTKRVISFQEFSGQDTSDLFLEERETALKNAQEEKRKIQLSVPGIVNLLGKSSFSAPGNR